ncbi:MULTISPECIES: nicotinate-nucleotide adenylyltransferase [unclassified Paenibacillus]|uniref:nicotinate-nucleotide adenylyltransferase n=1 Tax=unclassified Paenibacillus TaxID=185978 RepID=UPI001AEA708A|nr:MULTISPECIES: nicotinate-nucleotide adenylyltransferase [unclassified Paenibacillus]MBP1156386.1 nicotinate-nucleotide adenylyltransferase [Paenibacillus sp. PvP091]MBP1168228.1 nicotinate-nucleotide adenylyltransferase [Paenibacillus sp. PvR098]MBP2439256.1 nicotinate-nucleotide adenylyltransferase [Paenibacillus sp. PvP052]
MKIGLMGGTFDPVHIGHLIAAQSVCEELGLNEVWFMPTSVPPHKEQAPGASPEQRWKMVCLAAEGHPSFKPSDIELRKGGVSYSIETVTMLRSQYPDYEFFYIIGADMVQYLPKWHKINELIRLVTFVGLHRPGYETEIEGLPAPIRQAVRSVRMPQIELSSTWIRQRRAAGQSVRYMVPDRVNDYIEVNRLYEA